MVNEHPICYIIAGPNGAGKTTFATEFLPTYGECKIFINADLIAAGLSPFNPKSEAILAGRLMLEQIDRSAAQKVTFAFESTLPGKTYIERIKKYKEEGYAVCIFYVMLDDVDTSLKRIADRVQKGGHTISEEDARRRFPRSASNFIQLYSPLADEWQIFDNSLDTIRSVAQKADRGVEIFDETLYNKLINYGAGTRS